MVNLELVVVASSGSFDFGLDVFGMVDVHVTVENFVQAVKSSVSTSFLEGWPAKLIFQCSDAGVLAIGIGDESCGCILDFFQMVNIFVGVWVPSSGSVVKMRSDKCVK